ncbi:hypothetical protein ACFXO9_09565 [Nocardia tengchongensis]|uniref:hypothetical protein n=1 Tax=Nocardia tengchongensis TaxID=2055889 RepID=UPI0036A9DC04
MPVIPPFVRAQFGGGGTQAASITSKSPVPALAGAVGVLGASATARVPVSATASAAAALGCSLVYGGGTILAIPAQFSAAGNSTATDAAYRAAAALTVSVGAATTSVLAGFGSTTPLLTTQAGLPPTTNAAGNSMGTLSAITGVLATFSGGGTPAASLWSPAGMTKNGNLVLPKVTAGAWSQITGWTAETATYPNSTVTLDALIAQGSKANATVSVSLVWTPGWTANSNSLAVRIMQNGTQVAASTTSTTSPAQASASVAVALGDKFTVEVADTSSFGGIWPSTITGGTSSELKII